MRRLTAFIFPILFSCCVIAASVQTNDDRTGQDDTASSANNNTSSTRIFPPTPPLVLTFAGDLMAHNINFNMKMYDLIY